MKTHFRFKFICASLLSLMLLNNNINGQEETDVIKDRWIEYSDASNSLYNYLKDQAVLLLKQREQKVSEVQSPESWKKRQDYITATLLDIVGPLPGKTPLNPKIIRTIFRDRYRVEHIIFESQPGFYVTSSLYIPSGVKKGKKTPAVIYCSGHSVEGYRNSVYQHVILNLVTKGFIVFAFDPVGQGERLEYFDASSGKSSIGGPTSEHSYPGAQAFIAGSSQAKYMIWDGIRAVDYLLSRKEVDPARIGITGRSGGGTQAAYIAAMDGRIYAAAPENYLTNFTRLFQTIGPQDAEQNLTGFILRGLDHPDFLIVRAPRPALMITTSGDMFSIQGAIETEKEVSDIYKAFGKEDNFSRIEDDAGHASTIKNREAMYAFFQKHLDNPGSFTDEDIPLLTAQELKVTATGQVSTSVGGETVFSLNSRWAENLSEQIKIKRSSDSYLSEVPGVAAKISGYSEPSAPEEPVFSGRIKRGNYTIEKYFIKGEGNYIIPYLLFRPLISEKRVMIYLHPSGKSTEAKIGGEIEKFVKQGITVLAPDLIGVGEMGPGTFQGDANFNGVSHNIWYAGILTGKTIVGIRSADVVRLSMLMKRQFSDAEIIGFARRDMSPVLLHAAAFSSLFGRVVLVEPYSSYMSIVMNRFYNPQFIPGTVPGSLKDYDLPDLAAAIAPRKMFISGITDGSGKITDSDLVRKDIEVIKAGYKFRNAESQLKIITGASPDNEEFILLSAFLSH